jgi:[ribosomal protein S5]-alanine N-acetyltransferase
MEFIRKPDQDIFATKKTIHKILSYRKANPSFGLWCAFEKESSHFVGWVILKHIEDNVSYPVEVGYRLHYAYWGKGYATEMGKAIIQYAKVLKLPELSAITSHENIKSQNVLNKLGMTYLEDRLYYEVPVKYYEMKL